MRRFVPAALAALVAFATGAAGAVPARAADDACLTGQSCVIVTWSGDHIASGSRRFDAATLDGMATPGQLSYPYCGRTCPPIGDKDIGYTVPVVDLIDAIDGVGFGADDVSRAVVTDGQGHESDLSGATHDLAADDEHGLPFVDTYQDTPGYPVVYPVGSDSYGYFQSLRDTSGTDKNAQYDMQTGSDQPLRIALTIQGTVFRPTITTTRDHVDVGGSLTFHSALPPSAPSDVSYDWHVGTAVVGHDPTLTFRFDTAGGPYGVYLAVTATNAYGQSDEIDVTVGRQADPTGGRHPTPGRGAGGSRNPTAGPRSGEGARVGARPTAVRTGRYGASRGNASTDAPGTGRTDRGSASATASASPSSGGGFVRVDGLLLDPSQVVVSAHRTGRPETAPKARAGTVASSTPVFGLALGAAVVILLSLGVLGERRRPARAGRRRR